MGITPGSPRPSGGGLEPIPAQTMLGNPTGATALPTNMEPKQVVTFLGNPVVSDSPPSSPVHGLKWLDGTDGTLYVWIVDDSAGQWVELGPGVVPEVDRISLGFLLTWGASPATIATVARTSNVATVTTSTNHGMLVGQFVEVNSTTDNTFDATGASFATVLSVPTPDSFTYANVGTNKGTTIDSGTITTWNVINDAGHATQRNCRLQSISASGIQVQWDDLPSGTWRVESATFGNHQNNNNAVFTPLHNAVGLANCTIALRFRRTIFGRVYWNGTTTGGGITANANWVKEGDSGSVSYVDSTINALFIGHSSIELPTAGSRGASSWPMPEIQQCSNGVTPVLPNFQVSPFTADAYRPSGTGFWCQLLDASGNVMNQAAIEALSPASRAQIMWSRTADQVLTDHRRPLAAVTVFCSVNLVKI